MITTTTNVRIFRTIILDCLFFDFSYRALVLYNAALAALAGAPAGQNPVLLVAGQQMAGFVHWPAGRAVLALPGQDVVFVLGAITPNQILQHQPSYINAILIQS